jgi:hypothetical protein
MPDYKVVRMTDRPDLQPGGHYRDYKRAEIMIDELGPFTVEVEKKDGWELELRQKCEAEVRNVRSVTS